MPVTCAGIGVRLLVKDLLAAGTRRVWNRLINGPLKII